MDSAILERVAAIIAEHRAMELHEVLPSSRLAEDFGLAGDDGLELVKAYSKALGVDITEFQPVPHFGPEASSPIVVVLGAVAFAGYALPWTIPISVVSLIFGYRWLVRRDVPSGPYTLTVADLVAYAEIGYWGFDYGSVLSRAR
jgi:hypothetical protein